MFALLALVDSQGNKSASGWSPSIGKGKEFPLTRHDLGQPWCRMKQFEQTIRRRGCEEKTILNNLCYGQCRSFYIPYGRKTFESCSSCTPVSSKINTVVLNCPQRNPPSRVVKKVKIITYCSCRVCGKTYSWTACSRLQRARNWANYWCLIRTALYYICTTCPQQNTFVHHHKTNTNTQFFVGIFVA